MRLTKATVGVCCSFSILESGNEANKSYSRGLVLPSFPGLVCLSLAGSVALSPFWSLGMRLTKATVGVWCSFSSWEPGYEVNKSYSRGLVLFLQLGAWE